MLLAVRRFCITASLLLFAAISTASAQTDYFWNAPTGGSGPWDLATGNWATTSAGPVNYAWANTGSERANFGNTAGTVTLGTGITAYGVNITVANYVIAGGGNILTLVGPGGPINSSVAASISAPIGGSVGLTKTGSGTLTLSGANTYTGTTTVTGSTLIGVAQTSGSPFGATSNPVTLNGAGLTLKSLTTNTTTTTVGDLTVSATNGSTTGASNLNVDNTGGGAGNTTTFAAGNLVRGGAGSALVITPQTGFLGTRELITFSNGGSLVTNGIMAPWVVTTVSGSSLATDFVTYGGSGVGVATYTSSNLGSSTSTDVVNQFTPLTLAGAANAYALRTNAAITQSGNTINLGNGSGQTGLILNSGASITGGNVNFGATEAMVYAQGTTTLGGAGNTLTSNGMNVTALGASTITLGGNIVNGTQPAALNLTAITSGSTININGTNTYTGGSTLSYQGTLNVGNNSAFGTGKVTTIIVPGTSSPNFAASGGDRTLANAFDLNGGLNYTGTNSLQFNGPITVINSASGGNRTLQNQIGTAGKTLTFGASPGSSTITLGNPVANGGDGIGKMLIITPSASATTVINDIMQDPAAGGGTASGSVRYNGNAAGVTKLTSQSTYSGITDLAGSSIIQIAADSIGSYPTITSGPFGIGTIQANNSTNNLLRPVGGDATTGITRTVANPISMITGFQVSNDANSPKDSITFTGPISLNSPTSGRTINNSLTGAGATLTLGSSSSPSIITGNPSTSAAQNIAFSTANAVSSTVVNDAIQEAPGASGTTLSISAANANSGGNTTFNGVISTTGLITVSSGTVAATANASPGPTILFNAMNTGSGGVTFTGAGTLVPIVNNTTGTPGAVTAGPFGTGAITVNNGTNQHFRPTGGDRYLANALNCQTGFASDNATGENFNLIMAGAITFTGQDRFISNGFTAAVNPGHGNLILGDPSNPQTITLPSASTFKMSLMAIAGQIIVNDVVQNGTAVGNVAFNPNSGGDREIIVNAQNTYSGGSTIAGGTSGGGLGNVLLGVSSTLDGGGNLVSGPFGTGTLSAASTSSTPPSIVPYNADRTVANTVLMQANLGVANATGQTFNLTFTGPFSYNPGTGTANRQIINSMAGTLNLGSSGAPSTIGLSQAPGDVLTFTGQSTSNTVVNDVISDSPTALAAGNVVVAGSIVSLANANTYTGTTTVSGGKLLASNTTGSATGPGNVSVTGGILGGNGFIGGPVSVTNGHIAPGASAGKLTINNSVGFSPGSNFDIEIGGTSAGVTYDQLAVDTTATVDGSLNVSLINGFTDPVSPTDFTILTATGGVTGIFSNLVLPDPNWSVQYLANSVVLHVAAPVGVAGDYNHNGVVDAADYVIWRKQNGQTGAGLDADGNHDNVVNSLDYDYMRARFGNTSGAGSSLGGAAVPEPASLALFILGLAALPTFRRRK